MSLPSTRLFSFAAPLLMFVVLQSLVCVPVDADPETAVNEVGTSHTIVAALEEPEGVEFWFAIFFIFFGPNEGLNSLIECESLASGCVPPDCDPTEEPPDPDCFIDCDPFDLVLDDCLLNCFPPGCFNDGDQPISWTYTSNGEVGTDYIAVCAFTEEFTPGQFRSFLAGTGQGQAGVQQVIPEEALPEIIALLEEEFGCDVVTKEWVLPEEPPAPELSNLVIRKTCLNAGDDADFNVLVSQLETAIAADSLDCGEVMVVADLEEGFYTIRELITGPDANSFSTTILCTTAAGTVVVPGTLATVSLTAGVDLECIIVNAFDPQPAADPGTPPPAPPTIIVPVDIDNTNTNALDNDNLNNNNNENENTQEQSNVQEQTSDNNQTTTVNSNPSVVIDFE